VAVTRYPQCPLTGNCEFALTTEKGAKRNDRLWRWAQGVNATRYFSFGDGAWVMKQRRRIYYSAAQRAEIWDRWKAGESMSSIGRRLERESSSVFSVISPTGGIRPPDRHRAKPCVHT